MKDRAVEATAKNIELIVQLAEASKQKMANEPYNITNTKIQWKIIKIKTIFGLAVSTDWLPHFLEWNHINHQKYNSGRVKASQRVLSMLATHGPSK